MSMVNQCVARKCKPLNSDNKLANKVNVNKMILTQFVLQFLILTAVSVGYKQK